jgi:hypothetical protein
MDRTRENNQAVGVATRKAPYNAPKLRQLGEIAELTGTGAGSVTDGFLTAKQKGV